MGHVSVKQFSLFLVGCIALTLALCSVQCNDPKPTESLYLNHNDTVNYVGIQTCRSCHNEIYQSFIQTGMGSSFDLASHQKSAADFSGHHVVYDKHHDLYYHPFWKKDSMYVMEYRLNGRDTIHKRIEPVSYIIGSGQHTNSHLTNVNGYIYQLPLTWYAQKRKWDLPPGFEDGRNVRFSREIGLECMSCHNALPGYVENSGNKFETIPQGIDCERCHGPGEVHVQEKLAGKRVDTATQIDYTIVNPKKLSWERQIDVCQRCHLQGNVVLKPGKTFYDFKPGKRLSDYMEIYMPKYKGQEERFIMASHAERLQMSKCFLKSNTADATGLTCITCHNPHVSVKVTGKQVFNNACMKCHQSKDACTEKLEVRNKTQDNCWGCHMPKSGTIDIPHVTVTDHRIAIPVTHKAQNELQQFAGVYCINNKNDDAITKAQAYLSYYERFEGEAIALDSANAYMAGLKEEETLALRIHLAYLRHDYFKICQWATSVKREQATDPWLCYRIGQAFQNTNAFNDALAWYKRCTELAPANLDFCNKYGAMLVQLNSAESIPYLQELLRRNPKQSETLTNLGFAYVSKQDHAQAMNCYDRALALDPDMQQALFNKAALCNLSGDKKTARQLLQRVLKNDPNNTYVKQLLQQL